MRMKTVKAFVLVTILFAVAAFSYPLDKEMVPLGSERLKRQIAGLIRDVEGVIGVAAKHLESGDELTINGDTYFPMASVFKLPIFVEVLAQIKEGKLSLEEEISIEKTDQHISGLIWDLDVPGIKLTIRNLINLMMMLSDNSATDILLTRVGPENVNKRLRSYGIQEISINRTCQNLIMDYMGLDFKKYQGLTREEIRTTFSKERQENPEAYELAKKRFSQEMKDQSTPRAMNKLLEMIFHKEILDGESCDYILEVMLKCQTGEGRILAGFPRGVNLAHKTGTIGGTVNDVGIIYLPDGLGHVAITVFTKDTKQETPDVEKLIAHISRFVYDYFYFTVPGPDS